MKITIGSRREIIIPAHTMKRLGLIAGAELDVVEHQKAIVLVPRTGIPKDQKWYHTKTWQKMMQEAFEDVKMGRMLGPFESVEDFKRELKNRVRS